MWVPWKTALCSYLLCAAGAALAAETEPRPESSGDTQFKHSEENAVAGKAELETGLLARFWLKRDQLTDMERRLHPAWCAGAYRFPTLSPDLPSNWDDLPVKALADQMAYDAEGWIELKGDVVITQGGREINAARVALNQSTRRAALEGGVLMRDRDLVMQGADAQINLDTEVAEIRQAEFVLVASALRGDAQTIVRDQAGDVRLTKGAFTRCEPGSRSWTISAAELHLPKGEVFGTARNALLKVRGVPVFYTPYIKFPISDERQSGYLLPQIGFSGEDGAVLGLPYYLNLAPNYDATLTPRLLSKRGAGLDAEFRHLSHWDRTVLSAGYLRNDNLYNGEFDRADWEAGRIVGDPAPDQFNPADRWLVGVDHVGRLGRLRSRLAYTAVSDRDYFRDIASDVSGVNRISVARNAELRYRRGGLLMRLWAQGFQRLDENRLAEYQRLPQLDVSYSGQGPGRLQYSIAAAAAAFDRDAEGFQGVLALTGERLLLEPRVTLPFVWPFGFLSASAGYHYTAYALKSSAEPIEDDSPTRGIPVGSLGGGLIFERELKIFGADMVQTLEPRLQYLYQGYEDQDQLPLFDAKALTFGYGQLFRGNRFGGIDRIGDVSRLSVGVTTRFSGSANGRERLRASLGQIFYFKDRRVTLSGRTDDDDRQDVSAIAGELSSTFANRWRVRGNLVWDPNDGQVDEGAAAISYQAGARRILNLAYRKRLHEVIDQTDLSFYWPISIRYAVLGRWNYDLANSRTIEGLGGIEYNDCCWRVRLLVRRYRDHPAARSLAEGDSDSGLFLQLLFKGLGGLGGRLESMLERSVRGYRSANG